MTLARHSFESTDATSCDIHNCAVKDLVSLSAAHIKHLICSVILVPYHCLDVFFSLLCLLCVLCFFLHLLFYADFHA